MIVLAATASCATAISGVGTVAARPKPAPSPSVDVPAVPHYPLLRTAAHSAVGDPVTVDLCGAISAQPFARWGEPGEHWWQSAGRCYYDVVVNSRIWFGMDTDIVPAAGFDTSLAPRSEPNGPYRFPIVDSDCERAFRIGADVFDTHTYVQGGTVPDRTMCAAAEALMAQQRKAFGHPRVARRALASPSLTRYDMCGLIDAGHVDRLAGFAPLISIKHDDLGGECTAQGSGLTISVETVFLADDVPLTGKYVMVGGRRLNEDVNAGANSCELIAPQGEASDGASHEALNVEVAPNGDGAYHDPCTSGGQAVTAMLNAGGLR